MTTILFKIWTSPQFRSTEFIVELLHRTTNVLHLNCATMPKLMTLKACRFSGLMNMAVFSAPQVHALFRPTLLASWQKVERNLGRTTQRCPNSLLMGVVWLPLHFMGCANLHQQIQLWGIGEGKYAVSLQLLVCSWHCAIIASMETSHFYCLMP